jgi:hypothetical protein
MARMAQSFNSFCFFVIRHEQMPQLSKEACISIPDGIKLADREAAIVECRFNPEYLTKLPG